MEKQKREIVNLEAFNVIKNDMLASLNEKTESFNEAFGCELTEDETAAIIRECLETESYSASSKLILEKTNSFNDFFDCPNYVRFVQD